MSPEPSLGKGAGRWRKVWPAVVIVLGPLGVAAVLYYAIGSRSSARAPVAEELATVGGMCVSRVRFRRGPSRVYRMVLVIEVKRLVERPPMYGSLPGDELPMVQHVATGSPEAVTVSSEIRPIERIAIEVVPGRETRLNVIARLPYMGEEMRGLDGTAMPLTIHYEYLDDKGSAFGGAILTVPGLSQSWIGPDDHRGEAGAGRIVLGSYVSSRPEDEDFWVVHLCLEEGSP